MDKSGHAAAFCLAFESLQKNTAAAARRNRIGIKRA